MLISVYNRLDMTYCLQILLMPPPRVHDISVAMFRAMLCRDQHTQAPASNSDLSLGISVCKSSSVRIEPFSAYRDYHHGLGALGGAVLREHEFSKSQFRRCTDRCCAPITSKQQEKRSSHIADTSPLRNGKIHSSFSPSAQRPFAHLPAARYKFFRTWMSQFLRNWVPRLHNRSRSTGSGA